MDGIALALTSSLHLRDGHFLEASWDNYFYTRQWNTPPDVEVDRHAVRQRRAGRCGRGRGGRHVRRRRLRVRARHRHASRRSSRSTTATRCPSTPKPFVPSVPPSPTNGLERPLRRRRHA